MKYEKLVKNVSLVTRENYNSRENGEPSKILNIEELVKLVDRAKLVKQVNLGN